MIARYDEEYYKAMAIMDAEDKAAYDHIAKSVIQMQNDTQAFSLLYNTLLEVGDIIERGIREGERGYKKALHDARARLREIE